MPYKPEILKPVPALKRQFDQVKWQEFLVCRVTNCLAYALDCPEMGNARPGKLATEKNDLYETHVIAPDKMRALLVETDGLVEVDEQFALSTEFHVIALRLHITDPHGIGHEGGDFHFFRKNGDGFWSHKKNEFPPSEVDYTSQKIINPCQANFGEYSTFAGYFMIPEEGIPYVPRTKFNGYPGFD